MFASLALTRPLQASLFGAAGSPICWSVQGPAHLPGDLRDRDSCPRIWSSVSKQNLKDITRLE